MNWGKGIIAGMAVFMLFIIGMGVYMFTVPVDDYDHQYYEKGMVFNQEYKKERQVNVDHAWPSINISPTVLHIIFVSPAKGSIKFERPSDNKLDKRVAFDTGSAMNEAIDITALAAGHWQMEISWTSGNKSYLQHQEIMIP